MENISLLIVTDDAEYGRALALSLLSTCRDFVIKIFRKEEFAEKKKLFYEEKEWNVFTEQYDLILWDGDEVSRLYGNNIIFMAEKPSMVCKDFKEKRFCLYKYSVGRCLSGELFDIYSALTGRRPLSVNRRDMGFLAFASCSGGTGCSTVAMAVGQELSRFYGKRVFYFSLEEIESTGEFMATDGTAKSLAHYLYTLFKENETGSVIKEERAVYTPFMESYVVSDDFGIEAFSPTGGRNPLCSMNREEIRTFIESISLSGRYDMIIADLGSRLSETAIACLQMAERICMVSRGAGGVREAQYLQYLMIRCGEQTTDRIIKVRNMVKKSAMPAAAAGAAQHEDEPIATNIFIEKSGFTAGSNGVTGVVLEGDFGHKIELLAKAMTEPA